MKVFKINFWPKICLAKNCFQPKSFSFFVVVVDKIDISQLKLNMYMKLKQTVTIHFENGWIYCNGLNVRQNSIGPGNLRAPCMLACAMHFCF